MQWNLLIRKLSPPFPGISLLLFLFLKNITFFVYVLLNTCEFTEKINLSNLSSGVLFAEKEIIIEFGN